MKNFAIALLAGLPLIVGCSTPCTFHESSSTIVEAEQPKRDVLIDDIGVCVDDLHIIDTASIDISVHHDYSLNCDVAESVLIHDAGDYKYRIYRDPGTMVIARDNFRR